MNIVVNQQDSFRAAVLNGSKISFAEKTGGALAATEVRVNFKAASLNARDLMILDGQFGPMPLILFHFLMRPGKLSLLAMM